MPGRQACIARRCASAEIEAARRMIAMFVRVLDEAHFVEQRQQVAALSMAPARRCGSARAPPRASRAPFRRAWPMCRAHSAARANRRAGAACVRRASRWGTRRRSRTHRGRLPDRSGSLPTFRARRSSRGRTGSTTARRLRVGVEDERRFGLVETGQVIEVAVVAERIVGVAVAHDFRRGRHDRHAAARLPERGENAGAAGAVDVDGGFGL